MMTARPESRYHSKAAVLMSQPLKSSWARSPSSRYTPGAFAPPLWNWTLMSLPIPADGTIRYSTGRPGREKAPAVAEPPTTPTRAGNTAATMAATVSRRAQAPRIFPTKVMLLPIPSVECRTADLLRARVVNHIFTRSLSSECVLPGRRSSVQSRDQVRLQRVQLLAPVRPCVVARRGKHEGRVGAAGLGVGLLEVFIALDCHAFEAVGVELLVRVGAFVERGGTAGRTVDPQPCSIGHDARR